MKKCMNCQGKVQYFKAGRYYHILKCTECGTEYIGNPIKSRMIQ